MCKYKLLHPETQAGSSSLLKSWPDAVLVPLSKSNCHLLQGNESKAVTRTNMRADVNLLCFKELAFLEDSEARYLHLRPG